MTGQDISPDRVLALLERLRRAEGLLWDLLDSDECRYDHHGYCQTHGPGPIPCPVNEARKFLNSADARQEPDATQGGS